MIVKVYPCRAKSMPGMSSGFQRLFARMRRALTVAQSSSNPAVDAELPALEQNLASFNRS
jgi:hypothetical protein